MLLTCRAVFEADVFTTRFTILQTPGGDADRKPLPGVTAIPNHSPIRT